MKFSLPVLNGLMATTLATSADLTARNVTTEAASSYQWVCNASTGLDDADYQICIDYLIKHGDMACGHNPLGYPRNGYLIHYGGVFISALSYNALPQYVKCRDMAEAVGFIMERCHRQGGSVSAKGNSNLIVHMNDHFVD